MIEANLLFVLMIIFVIIIAQSTIYREYQRENFYGCNPTNGCAPCGYPCKLGCPENIVENYSSLMSGGAKGEGCSPMSLQLPNEKGCYGNEKDFPNSAMVEYDNTYPKCNSGSIIEGFDTNDTHSADYLNNFQIQIKQSCSPDEVDMGDTCIKTGCSLGFERGDGDASGTCFPQCLPGYETIDGNSGRCYKKCQLGYETQGNKCYRPQHTFDKHTMPYTGLTQEIVVTPPHQHVKTVNLVKDRNDPDRLPIEVAVMVDPTMAIPTSVPDMPINYGYDYGYGNDGNYNAYTGGNVNRYYQPSIQLNNGYNYQGPNNGRNNLSARGFGNSWLNYGNNVNDVNIVERFEGNPPSPNNNLDLPMPNILPQNIMGDNPNIQKPPTKQGSMTQIPIQQPSGIESQSSTSADSVPVKRTLNRDLFLPGDGEGCPYGYSVSGDTCYENCPPNYKDIDGRSCARESYVLDKENYDRGSGVPYRQVRNKYARIFPGN